MNIVIVGCGNIGFETAKRLCDEHKLLLISRSYPEDVARFVRSHDNVWFSLADATDPSSMEGALTEFVGKYNKLDALISTIGISCPTSLLDDVEQFKSEFFLNFFGNFVPIRAILKHMLSVGSGKIVVISSTSGVFAYPGLKAYVPAKWALTNFCRNLRDKIRQKGIFVDVVFPASIKNRRSHTFLFKDGIEPEKVVAEIVRILKAKHNTNHFIPRRYVLLPALERLFPQILDRRAGLQKKRTGRFRAQKVDSVLITGASSDLGRELAVLYAKTAAKLYLLGTNEQTLSETKKLITCSTDCIVEIACLDLADKLAVTAVTERIESVEMIINNADFSFSNPICEISIPDCERLFEKSLFGVIRLIVGFLRSQTLPLKIINIIPMVAAGERDQFDYHSTGRAGLWGFTRSLRRTFGNKMQVMEVIHTVRDGNYCEADSVKETEENTQCKKSCNHKAFLMVEMLSRRILELERRGVEIVIFPLRYKLYMYLAAIFPWRLK